MFAKFELCRVDPPQLPDSKPTHCAIDPRAVAGIIAINPGAESDFGRCEIRTVDGTQWYVFADAAEVERRLAVAQEAITRAAVQIAQG